MPVVVRRIVSARSRALKLALIGLATVTLASCGDSTGPSATDPNFVRLQSDAGDYIGGGKTLEFTQHNAIFKVTLTDNVVRIELQGDEKWFGSFAAPVGSSLARGTYAGATRFPLNPGNTPGLVWLSDSRVCSQLTGSFTIDRITVIDGVITNLDLHFDQRCEGSSATLRGTIHWRDDDSTTLDGPVSPIPTNLWTPDPAYVPTSGNYVMLASDPGDPIGQGQFIVYTPPTTIVVSSNGTTITVNVGGYSGTFVGMVGTNPLSAGYYGNLTRYPFHNPTRGGLDWSGNGRGCNTLTGWFAIDRIAYTGTTMTALEMRFEQHCEGGTPALHGAIRWSA